MVVDKKKLSSLYETFLMGMMTLVLYQTMETTLVHGQISSKCSTMSSVPPVALPSYMCVHGVHLLTMIRVSYQIVCYMW